MKFIWKYKPSRKAFTDPHNCDVLYIRIFDIAVGDNSIYNLLLLDDSTVI